jgi:hypothetical protein
LNPSLDERCPYARAPGVVLAIYPEDTHVCTYQCRIVVDGAARDSDWCGNACVFTDTAEHCRTCDRHCTGSTPYCDLNAQNYCVATPPR